MAATQISTLSLHDALPISLSPCPRRRGPIPGSGGRSGRGWLRSRRPPAGHTSRRRSSHRSRRPSGRRRSEEHTSELQSLTNLVFRLLLEKKKVSIFFLTPV